MTTSRCGHWSYNFLILQTYHRYIPLLPIFSTFFSVFCLSPRSDSYRGYSSSQHNIKQLSVMLKALKNGTTQQQLVFTGDNPQTFNCWHFCNLKEYIPCIRTGKVSFFPPQKPSSSTPPSCPPTCVGYISHTKWSNYNGVIVITWNRTCSSYSLSGGTISLPTSINTVQSSPRKIDELTAF